MPWITENGSRTRSTQPCWRRARCLSVAAQLARSKCDLASAVFLWKVRVHPFLDLRVFVSCVCATMASTRKSYSSYVVWLRLGFDGVLENGKCLLSPDVQPSLLSIYCVFA